MDSLKQFQLIKLITPSFTFNIQNLPHFIVPIKNMTQTLLSAHHIQSEKSVKELMLTFSSKSKERLLELGLYILSAVCGIFVMLFVYIIKLIKYKQNKLQRKMNKLQSEVDDIVDL